MATVSSNLRLNMTGAEADPALRALRYRTAIEMASYADAQGFSSVNVEEHHVADNGWLPSPWPPPSLRALSAAVLVSWRCW